MTTDLFNALWHDCHDSKLLSHLKGDLFRAVKHQYGQYALQLRQAQAFNLDDSTVRLISDLSHASPQRMRDRLGVARLPFPITWIEFNFRAKVQHAFAQGIAEDVNETTPDRVGFLLRQVNGDPDRWTLTEFSSKTEDRTPDQLRAGVLPGVFVVDLLARSPFKDRSILFHTGGKPMPLDETDQVDLHDSIAQLGWGYFNAHANTLGGPATITLDDLARPKELRDTLGIHVEPMNTMLQHNVKKTFEEVFTFAMESRGDVRFAVTALALLNEVPCEFVTSRPAGRIITSSGSRPFLESRTVTINVPTKRRRYLIDQRLRNVESESRKKRHRVRGHWRTSDKFAGPGWQWRYSERYGRYRWALWISDHERGDAALGWVDHTYEVQRA